MSVEVFKSIDRKLQADIKKGFASKNINASGNASRSLRSEISAKKYTLYGASYIDSAEVGRGKNRANTGGLYKGIYDWLQYKKYGITYKDDRQRKSIAFAIMKKIAKEGSYKFRNSSKRTNVIETAIEESRTVLLKDLAIFTLLSELKQLKDILK